jgi:plastocyanin
VVIDDDDADGFGPGTITIDAGGSVTWVNLDDDPHTATGADFDTGILQPGDLATVTFNEPGRFPYSCELHPVMTGTVEVRDASGAVPGATPQATPAASPQAGSADVTEVGIDNLAFIPDDVTVPVGTTVRWTNLETIPHTVRSSTGEFDSGIMQQGDTFEYTFDTDGVFDYICGLHPSMTARVTVGA